MVFSAPALGVPGIANGGGDVFADLLCEALFRSVVGNCDEFRRFKNAFNAKASGTRPAATSFDFGQYPGAAMAVEVVRKCPGDLNPMVNVTGGYTGLADEILGVYDPVYGGYAFFAPLVYADKDGLTSWLYIQNGGTECSSVEIWFKAVRRLPAAASVRRGQPGAGRDASSSPPPTASGPAGWAAPTCAAPSRWAMVVDTVGRTSHDQLPRRTRPS